MSGWDWVTISALATAAGTLVLAVATFASVRSANRAARVAEQALLLGLRPLLVTSRFGVDAEQKVGFVDGKWVKLPPGEAVAEVDADAIYLAISLRNAGTGIAVLHGWAITTEPEVARADVEPPGMEAFHRLSRDLYVPPGDIGFWQGAFRDPASDEFGAARRAIERGDHITVWLLYGDHQGGQRMISRFGLSPRAGGQGWVAAVARHIYLDADAPR
ncbi:MAG TPA: hypothetical protein VFH74_15025 [Gaiellales bacterium]|nr:hypothetical protein [Gaiellales bacterium]